MNTYQLEKIYNKLKIIFLQQKPHILLILALSSAILLLPQQSQCAAVEQESTDAQTTEGTKTLEEEVADLKKMVAELGRQAMLNQLYLEERVRSDGDSGLKQVCWLYLMERRRNRAWGKYLVNFRARRHFAFL